MSLKRTRIDMMDLDEVSLVGSGDDPEARVVISKAHKNAGSDQSSGTVISNTGTSEENMPEENDQTTDEISLDDLPEDVVQYIQTLESLLGDELEDDGELEEEPEPVLVGKSASTEDILKSNPDLAEIVKAATDRADEAERIAKHERDRRVEREMIEKAQQLPLIGDTTEDLASLLHKLNDADPTLATAVEGLLRKANDQLRESDLFSEVGKSTPGAGSVVAGVIAELQKNDPTLTAEQAEVLAYANNPGLYRDELKG